MNFMKYALIVLFMAVSSVMLIGQSQQPFKLGNGEHVARILDQSLDLSDEQVAVVRQLWIDSAPQGCLLYTSPSPRDS